MTEVSAAGRMAEPFVRFCLGKYVDKGEDAWLEKPASATKPVATDQGSVSIALFGVFDGHGGKQAATYASNHIMPNLLDALQGAKLPAEKVAVGEQKMDAVKQLGLSDEDVAAWRAQDAALTRLPEAMVSAFSSTERDFYTHSKESGTTASVTALVGWELVSANVGDSCVYVDTGSEVVQVTRSHRLDDSAAERERVLAAGAEVAQSEVDGKPVGPLRVWPGGLAMSRTIGDHEAGATCTCQPDVRQVTLPHTGARILLASDGLWDAVAAKTAAHHVRSLPATKAAKELVKMALKTRGARDDITVLVVDVLPNPDDRVPPLLRRHAQRGTAGAAGAGEAADCLDVLDPLTATDSSRWLTRLWERRLGAVQAAKDAAAAAAAAVEALERRNAAARAERSASEALTAREDPSSPSASTGTDSEDESGVAANHGAFAALEDDAGDDDEWETVPVKTASAKMVASAENGHTAPPPQQPVPGMVAEPSRGSASGGRGRSRGGRFGVIRGRGGRGAGGTLPRVAQVSEAVSGEQSGDGPIATVARDGYARGRGSRGRVPRGAGRAERGGRATATDCAQKASTDVVSAATGVDSAGRPPAEPPQRLEGGAPAAAPTGILQRFQSSFTALADAAQQFAGSAPAAGRGGGRDGRGRGRGRGGGRPGYREQRLQSSPGPRLSHHVEAQEAGFANPANTAAHLAQQGDAAHPAEAARRAAMAALVPQRRAQLAARPAGQMNGGAPSVAGNGANGAGKDDVKAAAQGQATASADGSVGSKQPTAGLENGGPTAFAPEHGGSGGKAPVAEQLQQQLRQQLQAAPYPERNHAAGASPAGKQHAQQAASHVHFSAANGTPAREAATAPPQANEHVGGRAEPRTVRAIGHVGTGRGAIRQRPPPIMQFGTFTDDVSVREAVPQAVRQVPAGRSGHSFNESVAAALGLAAKEPATSVPIAAVYSNGNGRKGEHDATASGPAAAAAGLSQTGGGFSGADAGGAEIKYGQDVRELTPQQRAARVGGGKHHRGRGGRAMHAGRAFVPSHSKHERDVRPVEAVR